MKIVDKTSEIKKGGRKSDTDDITYRIQGHVAILKNLEIKWCEIAKL